jgi:hypothetical protein
MRLDLECRLSNAQALGSNAEASTNIYDTTLDRNIGIGEPMAVMITVDTAAAVQTGSGTWTFQVQTDDNAGFTTPVTMVQRSIPGSVLTQGSVHVLPIPNDPISERYIRNYYDMDGNSPTITVSAHVVPQKFVDMGNIYYPNAFSIS